MPLKFLVFFSALMLASAARAEKIDLLCTNNGGAGREDAVTFDSSARTLTWAQHPEAPLRVKSMQRTNTGYILRLPASGTRSDLVVYINGPQSRLEVRNGRYTDSDPCHVIGGKSANAGSSGKAPAAPITQQHDNDAGGPQATQAMHHDEPGTVTYQGHGGAGENFSLKIGPARAGKAWVAVYVGANGCLGDIAGTATVRGDVLGLARDDQGNACRLTIRRSPAGATIHEDDCTFDHGPSCSFDTRGVTLRPLSGAQAQPPAAPVNQYRLKREVWMGAAEDRLSELHLSCGDGTMAFTFYLDGYKGQALNKVKDIKQPFVIEIRGADGDARKFPLSLYMTVADGGWVQEDGWNFTDGEATAFLDAFGQDGRLGLQTGKGAEVASWTLKGTSEMRESMRKVCNL